MDEWAGKKVVIVGLARQGTALARFACQAGATVVVTDLRTSDEVADARAELRDLEIEYVLGQHPVDMLKGTDLMAISGAVPADAPIVTAAREQGIRISNDSHEFIRRSPSAVIGVTGSAGKTTTTALTGVMGQVDGRRTWVGGNIGRGAVQLPTRTMGTKPTHRIRAKYHAKSLGPAPDYGELCRRQVEYPSLSNCERHCCTSGR
jgi:UDP-N-acetylmuramoylalanine--D-glutamate ligase